MTQIGYLCARTEVAARTDYAVADIVEMRNFGAFHDYAVLYLDAVTDMAVVADRGAASDICMRTYIAVFSDYAVALDIGAGFDDTALSEDDIAVYVYAVLNRSFDEFGGIG